MSGSGSGSIPPWEDDSSSSSSAVAVAEDIPFAHGADPKAFATQGPIEVSAPSVDELLDIMAKQIMEVVGWTQAEGFAEGFREASANARGMFQAAVIKLAARADQLRRG